MWDLPEPGLEPVSPALAGGFFFFLAGGFLTTAPPGKPHIYIFLNFILFFIQQVLISYPFYTYQCIYVNPILPILDILIL